MSLLDIFFKKPKKGTKSVIINDVEYKYVKNKNSKSVKISVSDPFKVVISIPYSCTYKAAEEIANKNKGWIIEHLDKMKTRIQNSSCPDNLIIEKGIFTTTIKKRGENIIFTYPIDKDFYSKEIQEEYKKALKRALYIKAKEYLPKRLDELAQGFGFKYNKLALKVHKTRWGSCSYYNNINLNINLITLDKKMIDYVLIHELCHTIEKNHGRGFWELVQKCMPDALAVRKELKKQRFSL